MKGFTTMPAVSNVRITPVTGALSKVTPTSISGSVATVTTTTNINILNDGDGIGLFEGTNTSGSYLLKSLVPGPGVSITSSGGNITISNATMGSNFATVAFTGNYNDLFNKPTIPTLITSLSHLTDISLTNPSVGQVLTYMGSGLWSAITPNSGSVILPTGTPQVFYFDVNYSGGFDSPAVANLPSGWTSTTNSSTITITHNVGRNPAIAAFHQSVCAVINGVPSATSSFMILSVPYNPPGGGFIQYDSNNMDQIILENFTSDNLNFNNASIAGAIVRVFITFV